MAEDKSTKRLGRGLAALIGDMERAPVPLNVSETPDARQEPQIVASDRTVPIEHITANRRNPRKAFNESELEELSNSIAEHGIVQPILVRPAGNNAYELIAGERRWRAAQRAGLHEVPIVIRDVDDRQALELAIIENVQRADLNPVEEALGYQQLMDEYEYRQADLGKVIGKSRSHVANTLRLLRLPDNVRGLLANGELSSGHARALIPLDNPAELAERIVRDGLSVRDTEQAAARLQNPKSASPSSQKAQPKDADTKALEKRLSDALGMKVAITDKGRERGRLTVDYKSLDQLDALIAKLTGGN